MRFTTTLTLLLCFICSALSAQSLWTGNVDSDWNNPDNWVNGIPAAGTVATIPGDPVGGNFPVYDGSAIINFTLQVSGEIRFNKLVYNIGNLINFNGGTIINDNQFINSGSVLFDNDGTFINNGMLENYGTFDNAASGLLDNRSGATFNNFGTLLSNGPINNAGTINSYGPLRSTTSFSNTGTFNNYDSFISPFGSALTNPAGASILVGPEGVFDLNTDLTNGGSIDNRGTFSLSTAGTLINNNSIVNTGSFELAGRIENNSTFNNNAVLIINDSGTLENNDGFANSGSIEISICGIFIQNASGNISGPVTSDGIVYEINGTVDVTDGELGREFSDLSERKIPVAGCKPNVVIELDQSGNADIAVSDIDKGSYGECGALIISRTVTPSSVTTADLGQIVVRLDLADEFGFTSFCDAVVTIIPYQEPVVPVDDPDITFDCPADITVTGLPGAGSAVASWTEPEATTNCSGGGIDCDALGTNISGYTYLGELNDSRYFVSTAAGNWTNANNTAQALGGELAVISDAAENEFIRSGIVNGSVWIGLTDEAQEGTFVWASGAPVSYTNWQVNEPSNNAGEHYTRLRFDTGEWTDRTNTQSYRHVVEFSCANNQPDCNALSDNISGFTLIGELNNSKYYLSSGSTGWNNAQSICASNGGNLVMIGSQAENDFIAAAISANTWIGLTDQQTEGSFVLADGSSPNYFNWNTSEPNNLNNEDGVEMYVSGKWNDQQLGTSRRYVMEIACPTPPANPCAARVTQSLRALWDFTAGTGNIVPDVSGVGSPLDLTIQNPGNVLWKQGCGLEINGSTRITTSGAASKINNAVKNSNAFTLEAWVAPANTTQSGPARIISISSSASLRNATLGQTGADYIGRTRTSISGNNGLPNTTAVGVVSTGLQHVVFTRSNSGVERIYVNGSQVQSLTRTGDLSNWDATMRLIIGNEFTDPRAWQGDIYLAAVYNRALSAAQVSQNFAAGECCAASGGGSGEITIEQVAGSSNGGEFLVGTNEVSYRVTDDCGNEEICSFEVTVEATPADFEIVSCPENLVIQTLPGAPSAFVTWPDPVVTSNCFRGEVANFEQTLGPDKDSDALIGSSTVIYALFDSCGNFQSCSFNLTVEGVPASLQVLDCPGDVSVSPDAGGNQAVVTWDAPTANSDCYRGAVSVIQIQGPSSGSLFDLGSTTIAYLIADGCNNTEVCFFDVTVGCRAAGTACDDGDASTFDDVEDGNCNCVGTPCPAAGSSCDDGDPTTTDDQEDGECNCAGTPCPTAGTACDDGDPTTTNDLEDGECNCAGTPCPAAGTACDDGDATTTNDQEDGECNCVGTPCPTAGTACDDGDATTTDDQEDGNCNCVGTPCPEAGTACDDGDPRTENDIEDGQCNCAGTPVSDCTETSNLALNGTATQSSTQQGAVAARAIDGNTNGFFYGGQSISQTGWEYQPWIEIDLGTIYNIESISVYNREDCCTDFFSDYHVLVSQTPFGGSSLTEAQATPGVIDLSESGTAARPSSYNIGEVGRYVRIQLAGTAFLSLAEIEVIGCVSDNTEPTCGDGIQNGNETGVDCGGPDCPECCPLAGTACDDGNPNTENDVEDGNCNCAGTPVGGNLCNTTTNLALGKSATQSSTQISAEASRAIDGNTSGNFYLDFSVSQTNWENQPWLEIDLGTVYNIESVNIFNRDDCCQSFLSNYYVLISDQPFASASLSDAINQAGVGAYQETEPAARPTVVTTARTGRYIRIQLEGTSFLALAEVEVIGCASDSSEPTCNDGVQNGDETGIDCGGANCPECCPLAGTACDDGDPNTINDTEDGNCNCAGELLPGTGELPEGYCTAKGLQPWVEYIANVSFGAIDHASLKDGYGDFTDQSTSVTKGNSYELIVTPGFSYNYFEEYIRVWIDFNRDGDLDDAGELVLEQISTPDNPAYPPTPISLVSGLIEIPADAQNGATLMRVAMQRETFAEDCGFFDLGEVEDYKVVIGDGAQGFAAGQSEILTFHARAAAGATKLDWVSNAGFKNSFFTIERSADGQEFEAIGQVKSTSEGVRAQQYQLIDPRPLFGDNYYRLRKHHKDGSVRLSDLRKVHFDQPLGDFTVFPNPTTDQVFIGLGEYSGQNGQIEIYNSLGQIIAQRSLTNIMFQPERFDCGAFTGGVYTVSVKIEGQRRMTKLLVISK